LNNWGVRAYVIGAIGEMRDSAVSVMVLMLVVSRGICGCQGDEEGGEDDGELHD